MSLKTKLANRLPIIRHKALQEFARLEQTCETRAQRLEQTCETRAQRLEQTCETRAQRLEQTCETRAQRLEHLQETAQAESMRLQQQTKNAVWALRDAAMRLEAPSGKRHIPIAMALDDAYFLPTAVSIASVLAHASKDTCYAFHLLVPEDFSRENKTCLQESLFTGNAHELKFLDMGKSYAKAFCRQERITLCTYYRLSLPHLLSQEDKCIYIDGDTVVLDDLSQLFFSDLSGAYLGGVRAAGYLRPDLSQRKAKAESLHIDALDTYVNAGVLLMNLAAMRFDHLEERFECAVKERFPDGDQDILNSVCYGKIRILPFRFNVMTKYDVSNPDAYSATPFLQEGYDSWEWNAGRWNPVIVHYADKEKPWANRTLPYADKWWETVESLPDTLKERIYTTYPDKMSKGV